MRDEVGSTIGAGVGRLGLVDEYSYNDFRGMTSTMYNIVDNIGFMIYEYEKHEYEG